MNVKKSFSIRLDEEVLEKYRYIAAKEYRSVNSQTVYNIEQLVRDYEKKNGVIIPHI